MVDLIQLRAVVITCIAVGWAHWSLEAHLPTPHLEAYHDLYVNGAHTGNETLCIAPGSNWAKLRDSTRKETRDYFFPGDIPQLHFTMQVNGTHGLVDKQPNQEGGQSSTFETSFIPLELTGSSRLRYNALDSVFAYHLDCVLGLGKVLPAIGVEISSRVQLKDKLRLPMSQKFAEYGFSFDEYHQQIFGTMQQQLSTEGKTQYFGESWLSRVTRVTCRKLCELIGGPIYCMDSGVQRALNELEAFHFILGSVDSSFTVAEMTDQKTSQKARMLLPNPVYRMLATYYSPDDPFLLRQSKPGCQHSIRLYERLLQASVNFGPSKDSKRTLAYRMGMAILEDPLMRKYWYRMLQSPRVMRRMGLRRSTYVAHIEKCVENFGKEHVFFR